MTGARRAEELRARLLRVVWEHVRGIDDENICNTPAAARAISAGADPRDVIAAMTSAAYETAFTILYMVTGTGTEVGNEHATSGWGLVDVTRTDEVEVIGDLHTFEGLYESLLSSDPTGLDGRDFIE